MAIAMPLIPVSVTDFSPLLDTPVSRMSKLRLLNIWISLQTKEQFIEKASGQVEAEVCLLREIVAMR